MRDRFPLVSGTSAGVPMSDAVAASLSDSALLILF